MKKIKLVFIIYFLILNDLNAQNPLILKAEAGSENIDIRKPVEDFGKLFFFQKINEKYGNPIYTLAKSLGTAATTEIVKDPSIISPTSGPYLYYENSFEFVKVNNLYFFTANTNLDEDSYYAEPWISDGTAAGTKLLKDIKPGYYGSKPHKYTKFGNKCIFLADYDYQSEPYISDGTEAGTFCLKDILPGQSSSGISSFTELNGYMYFWANDGVHGIELWRTDGTSLGTTLVQDFTLGGASTCSSTDNPIYIANNQLCFVVDSPTEGKELATFNGFEIILTPLPNGIVDTNPTEITIYDFNNLAFVSEASGTKKIYRMVVGYYSSPISEIYSSSNPFTKPGDLTRIDLKLAFTAFDDVEGIGLYILNFSNTNATKLADINTSAYTAGIDDTFPPKTEKRNQRIFIESDYKLFFVAKDAANGYQLWSYSSGHASATMHTAINPSGNTVFSHIKKSLNQLHFLAFDGVSYDIWRTENYTSNLHKYSYNYNPDTYENPYPLLGATNSNVLYFLGYNNTTGYELYKTNGFTYSNLIKDINNWSIQEYTSFSNLVSNSNRTIFNYKSRKSGLTIYTTNGKVNQTQELFDVYKYPLDQSLSDVCNFYYGGEFEKAIVFKDYFYFKYENKIWKTNGISTPNAVLNDIVVPMYSPNLNKNARQASVLVIGGEEEKALETVELNGFLYCIYNNKLWKTLNGNEWTLIYTPESFIAKLRKIGNNLYFASEDSDGIDGIYKSMGNLGGVSLVKSLGPYDLSSDNSNEPFVATTTHIYFTRNNSTSSGLELWKTDGTESGTTLLLNLGDGYRFFRFNSLNNIVFFQTQFYDYINQEYYFNYYRSDGTVTFSILDNKEIYGFSVFKNHAYFEAYSSAPNYELDLYRTDGTLNGTIIPNLSYNSDGNGLLGTAKSLYYSKGTALPNDEYISHVMQFEGKNNGEIFQHNFPNSVNYINRLHSGNNLLYYVAATQSPTEPYRLGLYAIKDCSLNFDAEDIVSNNTISEDLSKFSSTQKLNAGTNNQYFAKKSIELKPGFKAESGAVFKAQIGGCEYSTTN